MVNEDELDLPQYFAGYWTKFIDWIIHVAPIGRFIMNVELLRMWKQADFT